MKRLAVVVVVLAALAGGFVVGRTTAPKKSSVQLLAPGGVVDVGGTHSNVPTTTLAMRPLLGAPAALCAAPICTFLATGQNYAYFLTTTLNGEQLTGTLQAVIPDGGPVELHNRLYDVRGTLVGHTLTITIDGSNYQSLTTICSDGTIFGTANDGVITLSCPIATGVGTLTLNAASAADFSAAIPGVVQRVGLGPIQ